jgi:hypothetical protein
MWSRLRTTGIAPALSVAVAVGALTACSAPDERRPPSSCIDCEPDPDPNPNPSATPNDLDGDGRDNSVDRCDARDFGRLIVVDPEAGMSAREVVETDLAPLLAKVRGEPFEIVSRAEGGCAEEQTAIWLLRPPALAEHAAPERVVSRAAELESAAPQAYVIDAQRGAGVWIIAGSDRGLVHGMYELLERAGVRFLLPGDSWTVTPARADLSFDLQALRSPVFRTLSYFGTGGWGPGSSQFPIPDVGSDGAHATSLQGWRQRTRFPFQYSLGGHTWEDFSAVPEMKTVLDTEPAMRACRPCASDDAACLAGAQDALCGDRPDASYRRVPTEAARLNPTHHGLTLCGEASAPRACAAGEPATLEDPSDFTSGGGLMQLYGDRLLQGLSGAVQAVAADPTLEAIASVDASDGDGFCRCDKCRDMLRNGAEDIASVDQDGSVTDGIFHMANHLARRAATEHPGSSVNLYAYASRAAVPSIALEPNVFVVVIPNAFQQQHTGLSGDELTAAWATKSAENPRGPFRLGIYDYWALTDGSFDQPSYPLSSVTSLLGAWRGAGIEAVTNESTYGSGPMGLLWYVAAHLSWEPELDADALVSDWFSQGFGAAAPPLERMYRRFWVHGYGADPLELGAMFAALKESYSLLPDDAGARERLTALSTYAHYLRLLYELRAADETTQDAALDAVLTHVWRIAPTGMLHSFRLWELLTRDYQHPPRWAFSSSTEHGPAWDAVTAAGPVTADEMRALIDDGAARYPAIELIPPEAPFTGELVPLTTPPAEETVDLGESGYGDEWDGEYALYLTEGRSVSLSIAISGRGAAIPDARVLVRDPAGAVLIDRHVAVPLDGEQLEVLDITAGAAGIYRVTYQHAFNEFHVLHYPRSVPLVRVLPTDFSFFVPERLHWFFVPTGTRRFAFRSGCDQPTLFHSPQGDVEATWHGNVAVVDVPAVQDGVAWNMSAYCGSAQFLNLPNYVAYRADQLLVPADAL